MTRTEVMRLRRQMRHRIRAVVAERREAVDRRPAADARPVTEPEKQS